MSFDKSLAQDNPVLIEHKDIKLRKDAPMNKISSVKSQNCYHHCPHHDKPLNNHCSKHCDRICVHEKTFFNEFGLDITKMN